MRLIDAAALYVEVTEKYRDIKAGSYPFNIVAYDMARLVENAPTVDAEPVRHGRWIDEYNGKYANPRYICSNCKGKALYDFVRDELGNWKEEQALTEFCPHCGVKLDKEVQ